jgi:hypothetical protein
MAAAISISGLVKMFGTTRAVDGLDLVVETGGCTGSSARTDRADDDCPNPLGLAAG